MIYRFYRSPALSGMRQAALITHLQSVSPEIASVQTEWVYYVECDGVLYPPELGKLSDLLSKNLRSQLSGNGYIEVGPRLAIVSPYSSNAVAICHACGLNSITRIERTKRFVFTTTDGTTITAGLSEGVIPLLYDRMTEELYVRELSTFDPGVQPRPVECINILEEGRAALERANRSMGLGLTDYLAQYVYKHFVALDRNPTDAELFMFGQLNSNHCRHHDFNGQFVIDGYEMSDSLMDMIRKTVEAYPEGIEVAFKDNAAAIARHHIPMFQPARPGAPSAFCITEGEWCITVKVETHNHPTGTEPYQGAATGVGGWLRDQFGVGRGGQRLTAVACYYGGNSRIPGYIQPWETVIGVPPRKIATPLDILIKASNGASDYGNCEGCPVTIGAVRTFEQLVDDEWIGYIKPIMVAGGIGLIDSRHLEKQEPEAGLLVVQYGGDAYCIGIGGAGRSSVDAGSEEAEELDFASVQRGNPEMGQRTDRVTRACCELGDENPIVTIGDLGAGGDAVAPTEVTNPAGARIYLRKLPSGDPTMSVLELVCNEAQERMIVLIRKERLQLFEDICDRERCPYAVIGECTGDGKITFVDDDGSAPIDLGLDFLLSELPRKQTPTNRIERNLAPLELPKFNVQEALERVLRLPAVASKQWLVRKGDRSVGGLVAQQQCVGPLQLPISDYAVTADSYFALTGTAQAIGEQPIKGIINSAAGARMSIGEALTNIMWAKVSGLGSIKFSATWQWPGGHKGEDANLFDAVEAGTTLCRELGLAIPVGKDSMSMSATGKRDGVEVDIKAPGTVQFFAVAPMKDIRRKVTPDIKCPGKSRLLFMDLAGGRMRLGGSALAQVYGQIGNDVPDVENPHLLKRGCEAVQELVDRGLILAGHDRSDGGLITTLLEMAFAGNCGLNIDLGRDVPDRQVSIPELFNEELGVVIEFLPEQFGLILTVLRRHLVMNAAHDIGTTTRQKTIRIRHGETGVLNVPMPTLRDLWQETSYQFDRRQTHAALTEQERRVSFNRQGPSCVIGFSPAYLKPILHRSEARVAILREAGTNGDREMAAAFHMAGFETVDVTMTDLAESRVSLDRFRGIVFCGGFSYADTLDAGKGWAGVIRFNQRLREQFERFSTRPDTFTLGVCNGCQVMALLGWIPWRDIEPERQPRFIRNESEIFESRLSAVRILESPSIFFKGMESAVLGIWVAHGEGRLHCPDPSILKRVLSDNLAPLRFVDDQGHETEKYPLNPNGSPSGITALCSPDGRHLAMMPHAERLFLPWQWPYWPPEWKNVRISPWLRMYQNARQWCEENK